MKKILTVLSFFILCEAHLFAADKAAAGWMLMRKVKSPRPAAVSIISPRRQDLSGVLYNPAALASVEKIELLTISELGLIKDCYYGFLYAHPVSENDRLSAGLIYYDAGKETLYYIEDGAEQSRKVSLQKDCYGYMAYARKFSSKFHAGASFKYAQSRIADLESAQAYAFDLGASYFISDYVSVYLGGRNIGSSTEFLEKSEPLPASVSAGAGVMVGEAEDFFYTVAADFSYIIEEGRIINSFGVEVGKAPLAVFLENKTQTDEDSVSIGFYLFRDSFDISYSYGYSSFLNPVHRFALGFKFGKS